MTNQENIGHIVPRIMRYVYTANFLQLQISFPFYLNSVYSKLPFKIPYRYQFKGTLSILEKIRFGSAIGKHFAFLTPPDSDIFRVNDK